MLFEIYNNMCVICLGDMPHLYLCTENYIFVFHWAMKVGGREHGVLPYIVLYY